MYNQKAHAFSHERNVRFLPYQAGKLPWLSNVI
ncbi:hypothetical protein HNQ34_000972 [Anoxybacillus tepidamans]|uniref:Uncharacterized protein n=1 Tax=Anoxybacteroides tepidamans TaxID=265948 RepID=A0A7W8MVP5_9BACL|nr:hypothetical protein [Anoxybacillus tepidamans]